MKMELFKQLITELAAVNKMDEIKRQRQDNQYLIDRYKMAEQENIKIDSSTMYYIDQAKERVEICDKFIMD